MAASSSIRTRLVVMNFLEFAVWGAYLTSMGRYLGNIGLGPNIGWFYSVQGIVSMFMPALIGIIADRWVPAERMLGLCHLAAGLLMIGAALYGHAAGAQAQFAPLFTFYALSVAFFMPTIALGNSVAFTTLKQAGLDTVSAFPPIRVWGTVGFIVTMWVVDLTGFQKDQWQFAVSGALSIVLFLYSFTLPHCPVDKHAKRTSLVDALGLKAFTLFRQRRMAIFFVFSLFLGVCLQITNGFANPFISSFAAKQEYANTFGVQHANILISLSQLSETFCILLIPFCMKHFGIKRVMLMAMLAWVLRFALFGIGDPGSGVWMLILSMIVYGVAFDFFNISGALFVDTSTEGTIRSSAQGLFMLMTNGVGATIGTLGAQWVINQFTTAQTIGDQTYTVGNWPACWFIFATYALAISILFTLFFKAPPTPANTANT